jgi:hypothetical protein
LLLPAARSELGGHGSAEAVQRSASAGAAWQLALLTDGGRYVSTAGSSYLDADSGSPSYDFTNRNTTFMTWNLMHLAWMLSRSAACPRTPMPGADDQLWQSLSQNRPRRDPPVRPNRASRSECT